MPQDNIHLYYAFGNETSIMIEGRLLEERVFKVVEKSDTIRVNIWRKLKQLVNDEIKNQTVTLSVAGQDFHTKSNHEGYFLFDIPIALAEGYHDIFLQIEEHPVKEQFPLPIMIHEGVGIISDFDDTVIISDVTQKVKLVYNLLAKNYKQRTLVTGMKEHFEKICKENTTAFPSTLFFLTGSPKQLFDAINQFLDFHDFPNHQLLAKQIHGDAKDPLFDQLRYKTTQIENLFAFYPKMEWVLFGDNGEKDSEVYEAIAKKYPERVRAFYIRDVKSGEIKESRVK